MAGYGDDQGFEDWLTANGHSLPESAPAPAVLRQRGSSYVDGLYGSRFVGTPTAGFAQERAWPRTGARVYGAEIPDSTIPSAIIEASYAAAWHEALNPGSLSAAASASGAVKRERIEGAVEVEYFEGSGSALENATVSLSTVEGLLAPFLAKPFPAVLVV